MQTPRPTIRPRRCNIRKGGCGNLFTPRRAIQPLCGYECELKGAALALVRKAEKVKAQDRQATKQAKERLKTRRQWLDEAQAAFNRWVRTRDAGNACISCGRKHQGKWNAGHYRSTGACPELRFEPLNCHLQCEPCNTYLSGNLIPYRLALIGKIGTDLVQWLEGPHDPKKYTIDQLREIRDRYRRLGRELERAREMEAVA